jgi:hypothetical protein
MLTGIGPSPNGYRRTALKDHTRLEYLWQTHLGIAHNCTRQKCKHKKDCFSHNSAKIHFFYKKTLKTKDFFP